jgi:hypothetical protein
VLSKEAHFSHKFQCRPNIRLEPLGTIPRHGRSCALLRKNDSLCFFYGKYVPFVKGASLVKTCNLSVRSAGCGVHCANVCTDITEVGCCIANGGSLDVAEQGNTIMFQGRPVAIRGWGRQKRLSKERVSARYRADLPFQGSLCQADGPRIIVANIPSPREVTRAVLYFPKSFSDWSRRPTCSFA